MNLYDLEEWCGSELSGMSRRRIVSIINGQRMTDSSDTDESDDSGKFSNIKSKLLMHIILQFFFNYLMLPYF